MPWPVLAGQKVHLGYYSSGDMLGMLGGKVGLCGACLAAFGMKADELIKETRRSTSSELTAWTAEASGYFYSNEESYHVF